MEITCPKCDHDNDLDTGDLPDNACDSSQFECENCEHEFSIGWYAVAELR